jgi:16S rRNA C967 or C1407 C5-methylase (RsmB/RsmF family)
VVEENKELIMEGFMESFIYLLITVIILVLSMRKKSQVQQPESEPEEQTGDPFRDLFRDEEDEAEEYRGEHHPATMADRHKEAFPETGSWIIEEKEETNPWMTDAEVRQMTIDADEVMREAAGNNPIAELEGKVAYDAYDIEVDDDMNIAFDLKKAVIYSEIIQRRTF